MYIAFRPFFGGGGVNNFIEGADIVNRCTINVSGIGPYEIKNLETFQVVG
jgi:hypothetical protein